MKKKILLVSMVVLSFIVTGCTSRSATVSAYNTDYVYLGNPYKNSLSNVSYGLDFGQGYGLNYGLNEYGFGHGDDDYALGYGVVDYGSVGYGGVYYKNSWSKAPNHYH